MTDVHGRIERLTPGQRALLAQRLERIAGARSAFHAAGPAGRLVAYCVVGRQEAAPTAEDLRRFLSQRLPAFMVPSAFVPVDGLPVLANGKVDRGALARRQVIPATRAPVGAGATPVEVQLMRIWHDLIGIGEIGRDDNFFELGGHSLLLPRLIDRVHRECGVALPLGIVFQAPTVKGLAEVIQSRSGSPSSWRSLVAIRERGRRPPLYLVHGLAGEIGYFYNLARYIHPDQPIFGLQAPPEPFCELEPMAAHYLAEIRSHQPHGPYSLGGYCIGGCVAFEMARQLTEAGETVRFVAVIDSMVFAPPPLARRVTRLARKGPREILAAAKRAGRRTLARLASDSGPRRPAVDIRDVADMNMPSAFREAAAKHFRALLDYVPRSYRGDVWLFRSRDDRFDLDLGWRPLVEGRLQIEIVPGNHLEVLREPHLGETARQLSAAIEAVAAHEA